MMLVLVAATTLVASAVAGGAMSNPPATTGQTQPAPVSEISAEKKICKYEEVIGSKLRERICMTKAEWDAVARQTQDEINSMQRKSRIPN